MRIEIHKFTKKIGREMKRIESLGRKKKKFLWCVCVFYKTKKCNQFDRHFTHPMQMAHKTHRIYYTLVLGILDQVDVERYT